MLEHHHEKQLEKSEVKWEQVEKQMVKMLTLVKTYKPKTTSDDIILKNGEAQYYCLEGAHLIEPRRAPVHRVGAYGGPTIHVGKVPVHMGAFYATQTKPRPDILTTIDNGTIVITTSRIVFKGTRYTKTLQLAKLVDYENDPSTATVTFFAENSAKSIGIYYGSGTMFTTYIEMSLADLNNNRAQLISQWEQNIKDHDASKPHLEAQSAPPSEDTKTVPQTREAYSTPKSNIQPTDKVTPDTILNESNLTASNSQILPQQLNQPPEYPPGWYNDPYKQSQFRWWNGLAWTAFTS